MPSAIETLIEALTAPLLEAELSGEQIGRNRISVIQRLSEVLGNATLQVWLIEQHNDHIENRLGYWHPIVRNDVVPDIHGHIVLDQANSKDKDRPGKEVEVGPSPKLFQVVTDLFEQYGDGTEKVHCLPVYNPIPIENSGQTDFKQSRLPLAWVFASQRMDFELVQLAAAKALAFNLAILLQYGRSHRIVEATRECTSLLYETPTLTETFEKCADVMVKSCAAQGGGHIEFVDGRPRTLGFSKNDWLTADKQAKIERFVRDNVTAIPTLNDFAISISDGREIQTSAEFGNFLYIPIMGPSLFLETTEFIPITEADEISPEVTKNFGLPCESPSHALFLTGKKSPAYLGLNFSETDRVLCRSIARGLSTAAYSRFFEELFLSQARYFSSASPSEGMNLENALENIRKILPGIRSLQLVTIVRDPAGIYRIDGQTERGKSVRSPINDLILAQAQKIHAEQVAENQEQPTHGGELDEIKNTKLSASEQIRPIECACYVGSSNGATLIFQMTTRYEPLRFYVLELGSALLEKYRFRLLKHFMRELYHLHRTKDSVDERASLLAQIRHAVVNPIAAAVNNLDIYQRHTQLYGRSDEGWLKIRSDKEIRDLIPHAIFLNNQALLFINSGRFLFSSLSYGDIRFDQFKPLDLLNEVRLAFNYGLQERGQTWNLKITGDSSQSVIGDKILLWIVLANLIDNAIKYGHRDTEIAVTLEFRSDHWTFGIENTGEYVDRKLASRMFRPFERGDSVTPNINRRHGTGVGVAVSQMILRAHSESAGLKYTSTFKSGEQKRALTRFTFDMPYRISRASTSV